MDASYLKISEKDFQYKIDCFNRHLSNCNLCPRHCRTNRMYGITGYCKAGKMVRVANYESQMSDEPVLSGEYGSGVIRFSFCEVGCLFCNTCAINLDGVGTDITIKRLAEIMMELQDQDCVNIQLVTPTIFLPQIVKALYIARGMGLYIPIVYNTSGYVYVNIIQMLNGLIDIYMPDMKFTDEADTTEFMNIEDYPIINRRAVLEMHRQVGDLVVNENGVALRGLIVRHLLMPDRLQQVVLIMNFLSKKISGKTYFSIMGTYCPNEKIKNHTTIGRVVSKNEFEEIVKLREKLNLKNGWNQ